MDEIEPTSNEAGLRPAGTNESPLEHIVDDTEEVGDSREWIYREFVNGRDADAILAELLENGWSADEAEAMVEEQRRATRHLRGVITREGVARSVEQRSRKAYKMAFRIALAGVILVAITYGCHALTTSHGISNSTTKTDR